ncbi:translation initiation factor IF-2, partial [bacterium]|nr:translation initiation factor IF-2 [bacterium]
MIRQPIVAIMGHVDHGKTSLLDKIRGTGIAAREAGGITQAIGASILPLKTVQQICGNLLEQLKLKLTIPGLLFIDTPGHAAFVNLRKRGGNLADIAILVIDVNEGLMPQTKESIEILKHSKTPFIIAANKIDMIEGWRQKPGSFLQNLSLQSAETQRKFETKLYEVVAQVFELGIQADRFDRVSDYTKTAAVVPVSAKTGEGIPELLMLLTGLAQKYLEQSLKIEENGPAKGTIMEVKEQKGLGTVLDVIVYDGNLKVNDQILVGTLDEPIQAKIKALFEPEPNVEMREKKAKFKPVKE